MYSFIRQIFFISLIFMTMPLHAEDPVYAVFPVAPNITGGKLTQLPGGTHLNMNYSSLPADFGKKSREFRYESGNRRGKTPWMAISALPFAAGGIAAHFRTKELHREYMLSVQSAEAGELRKDLKQMQLIRNVSFGAAGLLGISGIVQMNGQNQRHRKVRIEYLPFACAGTIGFTF